MDKTLLNVRASGVAWPELQEQLHRSVGWLKRRHFQLLKDPTLPAPSGSSVNTSKVKVRHATLARQALQNLPNQCGTAKEICSEILKLDDLRISHLCRDVDTGPSRPRREKWMNYVAQKLSERPEFIKIGKQGPEFVWQLQVSTDE